MFDFSFSQNLSWAKPALPVPYQIGSCRYLVREALSNGSEEQESTSSIAEILKSNNFSPTYSNRTQLGIPENKFLD